MMNKNLLAFLMIIPLFFISCNDDDGYSNPETPTVTELNSKIYTLGTVGESGVSGTAKFIENSDATLSIELDLQDTPSEGIHPAHIHFNTAVETGGIALTLEDVNGNTGKSTTAFTSLNDGTAITYQELIDFNGYINVHLSATELSTLVAQGDIGQNELTGETISYDLNERNAVGINGTVKFAERVNQTTLVSINLDNTLTSGIHPAHIHDTATGNIIAGLNPVIGETGLSKTQVSSLVGGAAISYTELLTTNAYVNIHLSDDDLETIVAQGNIGSNADTDPESPESKTYDVTKSGASAYIFNGEGLSNSSNPNFTFRRGSTYTFNMDTPGHPFFINTVRGTGTANAYSSGVTNNGAVSGTITFTVPTNAPNTLYYNCQFHGSMNGTIAITD